MNDKTPEHPFVDSGEGYPTADSVRNALEMFNLDKLSEVSVSYGQERGSMVDLIARCRIEHLTQNWPKDFIAQVIGTATEAGSQ